MTSKIASRSHPHILMDAVPMSRMSAPPYHQALTGIDEPHSHDVLCGRGVTTNRHSGNEAFRRLVGLNKELYVSSTKKEKMRISRSVVDAVRSLDPPGRFLEKDPSSGKWFDIGDKKAVEKTSQALRDGAASLRQQLSQDLSDPDFLSAVFDMDAAQTSKSPSPVPSISSAVTKKKVIPTKCHRRVKSNPMETSVKSKQMPKRPHKASDTPLSPRGACHSSTQPLHGKPPQSPSPLSPRSAGGSPQPYLTIRVHPKAGHRRAHSQSSSPVRSANMGSPVNFGGRPYATHCVPSRSDSFEYNEPLENRRPPPAQFGSPKPHGYPPPLMSPSSYPQSPYGGHRSYHPPVSPRWSPHNAGYARSGTPPRSPHLYCHPDDYQHRRHSPDVQIRHPVSLRDQTYHHPHPQYHPARYYHDHPHTLAVPALGGEFQGTHRQLPMVPRHHFPPSPRQHSSPRGSPPNGYGQQSIPVDFAPPLPDSRRDVPTYYMSMPMEEDDMDEKKQECDDRNRNQNRYSHYASTPFDEKISSSSPAAVADMVKSHHSTKQDTRMMMSPHNREKTDDDYDNEYPSDEEQDPANERLSPLPFDQHEDPSSLMELPENILSLPISSCGPNDGEI